jgi:hypothetical protein
MPLESGTVISNLDSTWPLTSDPVGQGDDHIKLLKSVLKSQFPGSGGQGFSKVINATEDEINYLVGVSSSIQTQIDNIITGVSGALNAPAGTVLLFANAATPPGWTKLTSVDDAVLRVVSSATPGTTGGSISITNMSINHSHTTGTHVLVTSEIPNHRHSIFADVDSNTPIGPGLAYAAKMFDAGTTGANSYVITGSETDATVGKTSPAGSNGGHNHGPTSTLNMSLQPKYINVQQAVKS